MKDQLTKNNEVGTLEQAAKRKILNNLRRNLNLLQLEKIELKAIQYCKEHHIPYVTY